jgi:hypothetical protein
VAKAKTGRPSSFSQAMADLICERLAKPESLRSICEDETMPSKTTVLRWLRQSDEFRTQYARAREDQADAFADEILDIADDGRRDYVPDEDGHKVVDHDHIQRSKLRVETRKWLMGKMAPKKYGDRLQLANDPDNPIGNMTDEQVEARLADLMAKADPND